jgi:hypothetical protein
MDNNLTTRIDICRKRILWQLCVSIGHRCHDRFVSIVSYSCHSMLLVSIRFVSKEMSRNYRQQNPAIISIPDHWIHRSVAQSVNKVNQYLADKYMQLLLTSFEQTCRSVLVFIHSSFYSINDKNISTIR